MPKKIFDLGRRQPLGTIHIDMSSMRASLDRMKEQIGTSMADAARKAALSVTGFSAALAPLAEQMSAAEEQLTRARLIAQAEIDNAMSDAPTPPASIPNATCPDCSRGLLDVTTFADQGRQRGLCPQCAREFFINVLNGPQGAAAVAAMSAGEGASMSPSDFAELRRMRRQRAQTEIIQRRPGGPAMVRRKEIPVAAEPAPRAVDLPDD